MLSEAELLREAGIIPLPPLQDNEQKKKRKPTQAEQLIMLAHDAELFHDAEYEAYATFYVSDYRETWPLRGGCFRRWLLKRFWEEQRKAPGAQALQDALGVLEAKACFEGPELPVFTRLAEQDEKIYHDLGNDAWEVVEVSPEGWRVINSSPVKFRRSKGMLALPRPQAGGDLADLRRFINIDNEEAWRLLLAWLVAALRPTGPYPVLVLQGEQGSAKSTAAKVLRALVDPNTAPLRTTPREERDLAVAANNSWVLSFDNLSSVPLWLSDALCRVATGGGFATRTLYENDEETIFEYTRPVILNGIDEVIYRHDLLDRSLIVTLPVIPDDQRKDEKTFWAAFKKARPKILGALLDAVAAGLRNVDQVQLDRLPRMADFAKWVTAAEPALPWETGGFMEAYDSKRAEAVEQALEGDVVAVAVQSLLSGVESWTGSATELLEALGGYVPEQTQKTRAWPKTARTLSNRIRRAATFLRQVGVEVEFYREPGGNRKRLIRMNLNSSVPSVPSVPEPQESLMPCTFKGWDDGTALRDDEPF